MDIIVLTPDKKLFEGQAERVGIPGVDGEFEVLTNHAPIVSALGVGTIVITGTNREVTNITVSGGFVEVLDNHISLMVQQGTTPFNGADTEEN